MSAFGLSPKVLRCLEDTIRKALGPDAKAQVWIFGSRATGHHRPYSDIDLLIDSPLLTGQILARHKKGKAAKKVRVSAGEQRVGFQGGGSCSA